MSKKYDMVFQKFLAKNIDRSKMDSMIYGISRNGKRDIGYTPPMSSNFKPKPKEMVIKLKALYSHFTYGYTHDTDLTKSKVLQADEEKSEESSEE